MTHFGISNIWRTKPMWNCGWMNIDCRVFSFIVPPCLQRGCCCYKLPGAADSPRRPRRAYTTSGIWAGIAFVTSTQRIRGEAIKTWLKHIITLVCPITFEAVITEGRLKMAVIPTQLIQCFRRTTWIKARRSVTSWLLHFKVQILMELAV